MNLKFLLGLLLIAIEASAQTDTVFYNEYWERLPSRDSAEYYECPIIKLANGRYELRKYHINGNLESSTIFKDKHGKIADGYYKQYDKDGLLTAEGKNKNSRFEGVWKLYHDDAPSLRLVIPYKNGNYHGTLITYDRTGNVVRKEIYNNSYFKAGKCYTKNGKDTTFYIDRRIPIFPGGNILYPKYIESDSIYISYCRSIKNSVEVFYTCYFDEYGKIYKTVLAEDVDQQAAYTALKIIGNMPAWEPAIGEDGIAVKGKRTVDIEFNPL